MQLDFAREHTDPLAEGLPALVVDRQRVIHSAAFRRLQYKTQVFVAAEDHFRTRLTHTLEVANLARLLAGALSLNVDLAEAAALAHDLGHPPFGHAGERALDECLRGQTGFEQTGFEHNAHSLRVVELLEHPYPQFRGLNLTRAVRICLARHSTRFDHPGDHPLQDGGPLPEEGKVAALADRLAYALHDLQDGLYAGVIEPESLRGLRLWNECSDGAAVGKLLGDVRRELRPTIDRMQRLLIRDLLVSGGLAFSAGAERDLAALEALLMEQVYRNHRLVRMDANAMRIVRGVFEAYVSEPGLMAPRFAARVAEQGAARVACDYIAGMTDRFCLREHARLFDPRIEE